MAQSTPPTRDPDCEPDADVCCPPDVESDGESAIRVTAFPGQTLTLPFAWQHEREIFLLDRTERGWTVAELHFEYEGLHYLEVRRATYRWPREAAGALIARGLCFGQSPAEQLADDLDGWIGGYPRIAEPFAAD